MPIERVLPERLPTVVTSDPSLVALGIERASEVVARFWAGLLHDNLTAPPSQGGTPVKSGYAKASWILSVGGPSSMTGGSKGAPDFGPQEDGVRAIEGYRLEQGAIFMVNNSMHILRLNTGWSAQAPSGFVDAAFSRAYNTVNQTFTDL